MKFLLLPLLLMILSCSSDPSVAGGSSSETTSGIIVVTSAAGISGKAQAGSELILISRNHNPYYQSGFIDSILITESERFSFDSLTPGSYNLYARDTLTGNGVFLTGISAGGAVTSITANYQAPGSIEGTLNPDYAYSGMNLALIGTPFTADVEDLGAFTFQQIPEGIYHLWFPSDQIVDTGTGTEGNESTLELTVISDSTTTWKE